ncbi:unnamed protein product [Rotaria magnacalcarata]|uniref:Medium-chain acyl-CoA ligase ACSF2, mitochondrial n=1 Tax=Rotaria magnacalcarata TaxID=392030 RepID=A0A816MWG9_9BILA|nr:unnamed protein product [Rotaria magnacalcarata]
MSRSIVHRLPVWVIIGTQRRNNSTITQKIKLTSSYFHHASSFPLVHKTLSQSFDETATIYPDHECLVFRGEQKRYTYKTFKNEVDSIAASLLDLGFKTNDRFAVWLPNTSENAVMSFVASKLGIIKVYINPAYTERELEYCINKVGCKGIMLSPSVKSIDSLSTFRRLIPELDQHSSPNVELSVKAVPTLKHVIFTGERSPVSGAHSYMDLFKHGLQLSHDKRIEKQAPIDPDSPFAIFYTSGTTGHPKAATLTNFSALNIVRAQWEHLGRFFTRLCVPVPMFHIYGEAVGVLNIAVGKCQIIFPDILPNPVATMRAIHEEKCTAMIGATIIYRDILTHPDKKKYDLSSLIFGELGANPVHKDFLRQIEEEFPIKRVSQGYGMTEHSGRIASSMWAGDEDPKRRHSSIGRCMQGLEIKNEMIIRGGANIYPNEIEKTIIEHPSVAEAQVFSIPDERYGEEICAWIKLKTDAPKCLVEDIKNFLIDKLAFFKIPKHIRFVNEFITTPTGKMQKFKMSEVMTNELKHMTN